MGTLTINGRKIKVDDSFAKLSPADQQRTVEEIAAQLGAQPGPAPDAALNEKLAHPFGRNPAPVPQQQPARPDLLTSTAATVNGLVASVPFLQETSDALIGVAGMPFGKDYGETVRGLQDKRRQIAETAPIARASGEIGGLFGGALAL